MQLQVVYTEALGSPRLLCKKALNLTHGKLATPLAIKKQSYKRSAVRARDAGSMKIIFALLGGLRVWDNWLELRGINPYKTCCRPKVFLGIFDVVVRSLIYRNLQEHLDSCARLSMARVKAKCHCCEAWYCLTELLQTS